MLQILGAWKRFFVIAVVVFSKIVFSKLLYYSNILLTTIVIYGIPEVSNCESDNRSLVQLGGDRTGQRQHLKTFSEISEINDQFGDDDGDNEDDNFDDKSDYRTLKVINLVTKVPFW